MEQDIKPFLSDKFYGEGRGPESIQIHWAYSGKTLRAIDFLNPDETEPKHLFFTGVQVFMFTPDEVINYPTLPHEWMLFRPAAILCLGKSSWLKSFSPRHLGNCAHYQIMFYDELLDIVCENIEVREGNYLAENVRQ